MKPLKALILKLTDGELETLSLVRRYASSRVAERCLYVIKNAKEGLSAAKIAKQLQRDTRTVLTWLKSYQAMGIKGLEDSFNGGRPSTIRDKIKEVLPEILTSSPEERGFKASFWTVALLQQACQQVLDFSVKKKTVSRSLRDLGWSYKRTRSSVPSAAPSKEDKKKP